MTDDHGTHISTDVYTLAGAMLMRQSMGDEGRDLGFGPALDAFDGYLEGMTRTMKEKVQFFDKAAEDANVIIDFGCADGAMLRYLKRTNDRKGGEAKTYIGYDISQPMIDRARNAEGAEGIHFTTQWDEVTAQVEAAHNRGQRAILVLSSVMHEVLHYLEPKDKEEFFDRLWNSGFDSIAIRDMMPSRAIDRLSDPDDVRKVRERADPQKLHDWEEIWGSVDNQKSLVHFVLTLPYENNWVREIQENYFPHTQEEFINAIPDDYAIEKYEHFTHPMTKDYAKEKFDVNLRDDTHVKMVLRKADRLLDRVEQRQMTLH